MRAPTKDLLQIYDAALKAVAGQRVVQAEIETGNYPDLFHVVAIGKAAESMLQGVPKEKIKTALLISKDGHISQSIRQNSRVICVESDHPVPKENSIKAGKMLLDYLQNLADDQPCLFLISGGTSALVEVLDDDWDLLQLQQLTDYLLANNYSIDKINSVRQRLSKIKGGGLWQYIDSRHVYCLMISDVPDDKPAVIGSGLLFSSKATELPQLPSSWQDKINAYKAHQPGKNFNWKIIATLEGAKKAAAKKAKQLGYQTEIITDFIQGEATDCAKVCVTTIKNNPNKLFIWGGETTVNLPENSGMGGRNQHLALAAAIQMQDLKNGFLLAAGTDGSDGLSSATGAVVNAQTVQLGIDNNMDANKYLANADSNSYFQSVKGLIDTGATGTNVMDLVIAINAE